MPRTYPSLDAILKHGAIFQLGIKAFIYNEKDELLVIETVPNPGMPVFYDVPGGRIGEGEQPKDALLREIFEETGITDVEVADVCGYDVMHERFIAGDHHLGLALLAFTCKVKGTITVTVSEEHGSYRWASKAEAKELLSHTFSPSFVQNI